MSSLLLIPRLLSAEQPLNRRLLDSGRLEERFWLTAD